MKSSRIPTEEDVVRGIVAGETEVLCRFLSCGGDPNANFRSRSLLIWAAQESNLKAAEVLLAAGAGPSICDEDDYSPMYQAASEGDERFVALLVEHGADVNQMTLHGTALGIACAYERVAVARYLIAQGADPMHAGNSGKLLVTLLGNRTGGENFNTP